MNSPAQIGRTGALPAHAQRPQSSWLSRARQEWKRNRFAYIVMLPVLVHFLLFEFGPFVFSFVLTFMNWKLIGTPQFVGLANWRDSFNDPLVWQALRRVSNPPRVYPHRAKYGWDLIKNEDYMDSPDLQTVWTYNYTRPATGLRHRYQ
mgnify:CR=1 FL=1